MKEYPLVLVDWVDAQSDCEWGNEEKVSAWDKEEYLVRSVGWLIEENDSHLVICNELGCDGAFGNRTKVPKNWVKKKDVMKAFLHETKRRTNKRRSKKIH